MRKSGFFPRLALVNLLRNGRYYGPYLLSCGGTAAMYYILCYLTDSQIVASVRGAGYLQSLMYLGCIVVALFSAALLLYANSFVMKRRQRELGLYNILGLEKRHIALLCLWETAYCAWISIAGGIAVGVLFSKLTLLLLLQIAQLPVEFGFEISSKGMVSTASLFAALFALTLVYNLFHVGRSRPVELLRSNSMGEQEPRTKWLLVVLGLMTLGGGYILSWKVQNPVEALFFLAVVLVMIGTYCLFTAGSVAVLKALRANPGYYYQTRHFTAVAGLLHRMKQNAIGLANICILSTMVLVTVSTTITLYQSCEETLNQMYPYDVQVVQPLTDSGESIALPTPEETLDVVENALAACGRTASHFSYYAQAESWFDYSGNTIQWENTGIPGRLRLVTAEDYGRITGDPPDLADDQVLVCTEGLDLPDTFYVGSLPFHIAQRLGTGLPVNGSAIISSEYVSVLLVVANEAVVQEILAQSSEDIFSQEFLIQLNLDGTEDEKLSYAEYLLEKTGEGVSVNSHQDNAIDLYTMYGGFLFLGIFLGLLFLLATALIIYYKQISEGYEDQRRYQILRQVGMTDREIQASIHTQILLVFFLPLGIAGLHTAAAYPMVSKLLELFQLTSPARYALCTAGTLMVFCAVYALVYGLTARVYRRIVS